MRDLSYRILYWRTRQTGHACDHVELVRYLSHIVDDVHWDIDPESRHFHADCHLCYYLLGGWLPRWADGHGQAGQPYSRHHDAMWDMPPVADDDTGDFRTRHTDEPHGYYNRVRGMPWGGSVVGWRGCDQTVEPLPDDESVRALPQIDDDVQRDRHEPHGYHNRVYDVPWSGSVMGGWGCDQTVEPLPNDESV